MKKNILIRITYFFICLVLGVNVYAGSENIDPTENIAINKEAYCSSGNAREAIDDNIGTRWESASTNDQWWYVDLEDIYELNHIEICWEGAYGKSFELLATNEIPDAGQEYAEWRRILLVEGQELAGFPYEQRLEVAGKIGRYIKFKGIERGTTYGYSFWEFRVFANNMIIPGGEQVLTSVEAFLPSLILEEGQEIPVRISTYDQYYNKFTTAEVDLNIVGEQSGLEVIQSNGEFYLRTITAGNYQLVATAKAGTTEIETAFSITVIETLVPQNIVIEISGHELEPIEGEIPGAVIGRAIELSVGELKDQFGNNYPVANLQWVVEGSEGTVENRKYTPTSKGTSTIYAKVGNKRSNEITIKTIALGDNIALGKNVEAHENSLQETAPNVVDGNDGSLWQHPHPEGEDDTFRDYESWVVIDLEQTYENIELVEVYWEGARAADYKVLFSTDGENYEDIGYSLEGLEGVKNVTHQFFGKGAKGRYIKIHTTKAATQYGVKIRQVRAYALLDAPVLTSVGLKDVDVVVGEEVIIAVQPYDQYGGDFRGATVDVTIVGNNVTGVTIENREGQFYLKGVEEGAYQIKATANDGKGISVESEIVSVKVVAGRRLDTIVISGIPTVIRAEVTIPISIELYDQYGDLFESTDPITWQVEGGGKVINDNFISFELGQVSIKAELGEVGSNTIFTNAVAYNKNIALGKEVEAIGENAAAEMFKEKAVDGDENSRWTYNPDEDKNIAPYEYEAWITVDLGDVYDINMVEISWEGACAADYGIYYSLDNEAFGDAVYAMEDVPGMQAVTHQFYGNEGKARYVKMLSSKAATQYGVSIYEFRIFGTKELTVEREGNHLIVAGKWSDEIFAAADSPEITSCDMTEVVGLLAKPSTENPNCLIYVNETTAIGAEINVVAGERAESIILEDGHPYDNILEFTANSVEYVRDFSAISGWTTLYLPFTIEAGNRTVEELGDEATGKVMFGKITQIEANVPYLLKVDNNLGESFTANGNIQMPVSAKTDFPVKGSTIFKGTFTEISAENKFSLNSNTTAFVAQSASSSIVPFRGYIETSQIGDLTILHDGEWTPSNIKSSSSDSGLLVWSTEGELNIFAPAAQQIVIYGLEGRVINKVKVQEGLNIINGLVKGIYIINNQKVLIK